MNKWMMGVCLLTLFASCSKDDDHTNQSGNNNDVVDGGAGIFFSSNVTSSIVVEVDGPQTRAPLTAFPANAQIGIYGIPAVDGGRNEDCDLYNKKREEDFQPNLFNACYTYVPGYETLQTEHPATFPSRSNPSLMLYGYYPYNEEASWREIGGVAQWVVPWKLNKDDMSATTDFMFTGPVQADYSKVGVNPIVLNFQHAFGRLDFCFYSTNKDVSFSYSVQGVKVYCSSGESGLMSVANGQLLFSPTDMICSYPVGDVGITYNVPGESVAKFMFPPLQTAIKKITCTVKDGGGNVKDYTIYEYPYSGYDISIKQGKTVLMRVNFLPKDANFSGPANVDSWTGGNTIDGNIKLQ